MMAPLTVSQSLTITKNKFPFLEKIVEDSNDSSNNEDRKKRKLHVFQIVTFVILFASYATYNLSRKAISYATPTLIATSLITQNGVGLIGSSQNTAYAISKFVAGVMSDKISAKWLLTTGLLLSGLSALAVAASSNSHLWILLWFLNGLAQGCGWPACSKILKKWFSNTNFGTCWSLLTASSNVAGSLGPIFSAFLIIHFNWRAVLLAAGCISIAMAIVAILFLKDNPNDVGLTLGTIKSKTVTSANIKSTAISWKVLLRSRLLWTVSICYLIVFGIKTALTDWSQVFLMHDLGQSQLQASAFISCLEAGGFFGGIMSGFVTDKLHSKILGVNPRLLVASIFLFGTISGLHSMAILFTPESSQTFTSVIAFTLGASLFGPISIFGIVASESFPNSISGTAHAIVALAANIGAIMAGWPLGKLAHAYSWANSFLLMEVSAAVVVLLIFLSSQVRHKDKKE